MYRTSNTKVNETFPLTDIFEGVKDGIEVYLKFADREGFSKTSKKGDIFDSIALSRKEMLELGKMGSLDYIHLFLDFPIPSLLNFKIFQVESFRQQLHRKDDLEVTRYYYSYKKATSAVEKFIKDVPEGLEYRVIIREMPLIGETKELFDSNED